MGYEIFITRRENWSDEGGPEITFTEWLSYLSIDPSLERDAPFDSSRSMRTHQESTHVIWTDWPNKSDGHEARFWLENGNIVASDTDEEIRRKLFVIAHVLEGKVQGTDGETYDSIGKPETRIKRSTRRAISRSNLKSQSKPTRQSARAPTTQAAQAVEADVPPKKKPRSTKQRAAKAWWKFW